MKSSHRMVCEVERVYFARSGVERGVQEAVQRRLDAGWTLRAATGCDSGAVLIFVKKVAATRSG